MQAKKLICFVVALVLALPALAAAQEGPVIWLSFVQAKQGQSQGLNQYLIEENGPIYDQLMAEGAVLSWGIAQPITHTPKQRYSHIEAVVFPNWEGVNSFVTTFMGTMMARSPEEREAEQARWESLVEHGSHFDEVNRGLWIGGTPQEDEPAYMNLAFFDVKPGADFMALFDSFAKPVFEKASADGAIGRFGIEAPEIHGDHGWTHLVWYETASLGGRDAVEAGFAAADAARSEEEKAAIGAQIEATVVEDGHWDEIAALIHWVDGAAGDDGDE